MIMPTTGTLPITGGICISGSIRIMAEPWPGRSPKGLTQIDPAHGEIYTANAQAFDARLKLLTDEITRRLEPLRLKPQGIEPQGIGPQGIGPQGIEPLGLKPLGHNRYIVLHDAYRAFEERFGLRSAGALSNSRNVRQVPAESTGCNN